MNFEYWMRSLRGLALAASMLWVVGCGNGGVGTDGDVVGGACDAAGGCAGGSFCIVEGDFPGGTCSIMCDSQADCPSGSACVTENGGVCLLACESNGDCREGYACEEKSAPGDGHAFVCIN